jgi:site-specific DNA recombinase
MKTIPSALTDTPRVALYCRVSTEEQAERQTVDAQLDFLRRWCDLHEVPVAGEYVDDGVSGTVPLPDREYGARLLADAEAHQFTGVLVYRLDRLARSLRVLLDTHLALERQSISIRSATEPFDTASPIGRFMFQLLGSMAELEKSTITERMSLGRDRVARQGKWTGGPIPYGFDLDTEACLVPSARLVEAVGQTEADVVREVFERIAAGSSAVLEAKRLQAVAVPCARRFAGGKVVVCSDIWQADRVVGMIRNTAYKGYHVMHTKSGPVERPTAALVSTEVWDQANAQLTRNRLMATRNAKNRYLLRGLVRCACCSRGYAGTTGWIRRKAGDRWYRCNGQFSSRERLRGNRCRSKAVWADDLEREVWAGCREFILHPGPALAEAQQQLRARLAQTTDLDQRRRALQQQLARKEAEREPVLTLLRRGRITLAEAECQLDALAQEMGDLRQAIDILSAQAAQTAAAEAHLTDAAAMLARLGDKLAEIEAKDDWALKREVVESLVARVLIHTEGEARARHAKAIITYAFEPVTVVDAARDCCSRTPP